MANHNSDQRARRRSASPVEADVADAAVPVGNRRTTSILIEIRIDAAKAIAAIGGAVALIIAAANGLPIHLPF